MVIGWRVGAAWGRRVEVLGGVVLIAIGVKVLVQHLKGG
jgi:putative Mn2+ efflux pump MntP